MKITKLLFVFAVLLLGLPLTGCGDQATPIVEPTPTAFAYPPPMNDPDEVAASLTAIPEEEGAVAPAGRRGDSRRGIETHT